MDLFKIDTEIYHLGFRMPEIHDSTEAEEKVKQNYIFDDIPGKKRVKSFSFKRNEEDIEEIKKRIIASRKFMEEINL